MKLRHPGAITVYFFEAAMHMKSNCGYQHVKASGCFCFAINLSTAAVAKTRFLICSGTDITEERRAQERLRILANTDSITGLPNRNAMQELIDHAINQADNNKVGVVYLDLDNFKKVNDAYGHLFGDQLLRDVSLAILSCLEHDQVLARPGGDEFLVLASNTSQSALEAMASRILTRLRLPFRIGLIEVYTSCSVGISLSPEHGSDSAAIIRHADTAMYTAKEGGRGQFCVLPQK